MAEPSVYPPPGTIGRRQLRLVRAFDLVRNPQDWKAPIQAVIPARSKRSVQSAVIVFTGSWPRFREVPGDPESLVVTAPGYRYQTAEALTGA
jgi:hypothetical protein